MNRGALRPLLLGLALAGACGPAHRDAGTTRSAPPISNDVRRALVLPPAPAAGEALAALERSHDTCAGRWLRARYLVDLFDWVRLLPPPPRSDRALALLWRGCGLQGKPARGPIATRQVVAALRALATGAAERCDGQDADLHRAARTLLDLLETDRASRATPEAALAVAVGYRRILQSGTPAAPNARLRLVDWCAQAFQLAAGGDPVDQHARLNQCLFALFPADPRPYFEAPVQRPPDPPWTVLRQTMERSRDALLDTRLAPLVRRLAAEHDQFFSHAGPVLPAPLNLSRLDLPRVQDGLPWDRTPVTVVVARGFMVDGRAVLEGDEKALEQAIAARLHNDGRRHITVVAERTAPASRIMELGRAARRADAATMGLAGVHVVARPTRGDVQQEVFGNGPVLRLEEIPVSLQLVAATEAGGPARTLPRGMTYDPRTAQGQLALVLARDGPRILSRDGRMGPVKLQDLPGQLVELQRVYPEDRSIVLVPDKPTTYEDLLAVAAAVRRHAGRALFPGIALAPRMRVSAPDRDLQKVVRLLARARVELVPPWSRSWVALARQCYLETLRKLLDRDGKLPAGTLRVRSGPRGVRVVGGSLRHGAMRRCLGQRLGTVPAPEGAGPFTFTFSH